MYQSQQNIFLMGNTPWHTKNYAKIPIWYFINCHLGIDCTKANKTYFLWVTHQWHKDNMPKYQYDIISKFDDYLPISIFSIDKNLDNKVQLQFSIVFFSYILQINDLISPWVEHLVEIGKRSKFGLEILHFPE